MRKRLLVILFVLIACAGKAQDTVSENTSWYMFKSHGNLAYMIHEKPIPIIGHSINRFWGYFFPIVRLRCTAPYLSMAGHDGVTAPLPQDLYLVCTTAHSRARRVAVLH